MCNASRQITRQLKEIAELYFGYISIAAITSGKMYGTDVVKNEHWYVYTFERVTLQRLSMYKCTMQQHITFCNMFTTSSIFRL